MKKEFTIKDEFKKNYKKINNEEKELLNQLKKDYACGICLSVVVNAITTPCGHLYCKLCIKRWEQSVFPYMSCPKCRKPFDMDNAITVYNSSSNSIDRNMKLTKKHKEKLNMEIPTNCQKMGNIIIYESDFSDGISLKSIVYLILAFSLTIGFLFLLFNFKF